MWETELSGPGLAQYQSRKSTFKLKSDLFGPSGSVTYNWFVVTVDGDVRALCWCDDGHVFEIVHLMRACHNSFINVLKKLKSSNVIAVLICSKYRTFFH